MRERIWAGMHDLAAMAGSGASHRATQQVGAVTVSDMGVPHAWGLNAVVGPAMPVAGDLDRAIDWLAQREQGSGWLVSVPPSLTDAVTAHAELAVIDALPLYAMPAEVARALTPVDVPGVDVVRSDDLAEVRAAYGGWMADPGLAALLVSADDLAHPRRAFLVARVDGAPVGCALVWWVAGTGYLSGIGVLAEHRGRGYGRALTTAAARLAAAGADAGPIPDVIWMGATDEGAALYSRMGFTLVDSEVRLGRHADDDGGTIEMTAVHRGEESR